VFLNKITSSLPKTTAEHLGLRSPGHHQRRPVSAEHPAIRPAMAITELSLATITIAEQRGR
jgi:hypothetical protein